MDNQKNETKKCKYCQSDMLKKSNVCPKCKRVQNNSVVAFLIAIAFLFALGKICGRANNKTGDAKEEKNITVENAVEVTEDYNTVLQYDNRIEENIEQKENIYVEEHELINKEDVSINISNVVQDNKKTAFNFTIINGSSKDYSVSAHTFSVNGVMAGANLYGFGNVDVPTGKKAKLSIEIENEWLKENEIDNIGLLDVIFWSYYDGTKEWDSGKISVETNLYDENAAYVPKGKKFIQMII